MINENARSKDMSGDRYCDKCDAVTPHFKDSRCKPCRKPYKLAASKRYRDATDRSGKYLCVDCGQTTDHTKGGTCKPCKKKIDTCPCGKNRSYCADCTPIAKIMTSKKFCHICCKTILSQARYRSGVFFCAGCEAASPPRIEHLLRPRFVSAIGMGANTFDEAVTSGGACGDVTTLSRPDMTWYTVDDDFANPRIVVIEVDEHSHTHSDYDPSCEARRMSEQFIALQASAVRCFGSAETRVLFLRLNPDAYDGGGRINLETRIEAVAAEARRFLFEDGWRDFSPLAPNIAYFYYHKSGRKYIEYMQARPDAANVYLIHPRHDDDSHDVCPIRHCETDDDCEQCDNYGTLNC